MAFEAKRFSSTRVVCPAVCMAMQVGLGLMLVGCSVDHRDVRFAPDASTQAEGSTPDATATEDRTAASERPNDANDRPDGSLDVWPNTDTGVGADDHAVATQQDGDLVDSRPTSDSTTPETGPVADALPDVVTDSRVAAPRLMAPLSTASVTSRRPQLRWSLPAGTEGARIEICQDRLCTRVDATFDVMGTSGAPTQDLAIGVHFWRAYGKNANAIGQTASVSWQFTVGAVPGLDGGARLDSSWGTSMDMNGDGYSDIAIGAPHANANAGRAYFYSGKAKDMDIVPSAFLNPPTGDLAGEFGYPVAGVGDVDGDGFADMMTGAPMLNDNVGRAYLIRGSEQGPILKPSVLYAPDGGRFGMAISAAGDIDGDGYGDVVVGAPFAGGGPGRAYVFQGSANGLVPGGTRLSQGNSSTWSYGQSVASAGDMNGDGFADVIVASSSDDHAFIFFGSASGPTGPIFFTQNVPDGAGLNAVANGGDVNGDGYSDVLVSFPRWAEVAGRVKLYLGGPGGPKESTVLDSPDGKESQFGVGMAALDFNGDGFGDVVVGAPYGGYSSTSSIPYGHAYLYLGGPAGLATTPISLTPTKPTYTFATAMTLAGDVNGDGLPDLIVGAQNTSGNAYIYCGAAIASGTTTLPSNVDFSPVDADSYFGCSVASIRSLLTRGRRGNRWL